ncbi:MAG: hypothetical protein PHI85_06140 [Victivallaceae bacterium]|nr:hypothetical protein [Victivallaceae bacterium]
MDMKLGLGDWSVAAAYLLNIFGALFCVAYAFCTVRKARGKR